MAWECRSKPIILQATAQAPTKHRIIQPVTICMPTPVRTAPVKASEMMGDAAWVAQVQTAFVLPEDIQLTHTPEDAARADHLQGILTARLYVHVRTRVVDTSKHSHWCLQWAHHNLPRLCAIAVMIRHIKGNIVTARSDACLLSPKISAFQKVECTQAQDAGAAMSASKVAASLEGCYLYREASDDESRWIRSGKSSGLNCNLGSRHKQHQKASLLKEDKPSKFYLSYPCKSTNFQGSMRRGWFQDVSQYVGMAFDRHDTQAVHVLCDEEHGIFEWQSHIYACLQQCPWQQQDMINKQLNMVAYLVELFYDLCLSPQDNVSESPGFELPMGIHCVAPNS